MYPIVTLRLRLSNFAYEELTHDEMGDKVSEIRVSREHVTVYKPITAGVEYSLYFAPKFASLGNSSAYILLRRRARYGERNYFASIPLLLGLKDETIGKIS